MGDLILKGVEKYVEAHPEQIVNLLSQIVDYLTNKLKAHNAQTPA